MYCIWHVEACLAVRSDDHMQLYRVLWQRCRNKSAAAAHSSDLYELCGIQNGGSLYDLQSHPPNVQGTYLSKPAGARILESCNGRRRLRPSEDLERSKAVKSKAIRTSSSSSVVAAPIWSLTADYILNPAPPRPI